MLRPNISNEEYHSDTALGSSRARQLLGSCPAKVKHSMQFPTPSTPALLNGSMVHTATLEPALTDIEFGCKPSKIDGYSSRTNAYKDAMAEMEAAEPNKRWLPPADYNMCMDVAGSAREHPLLMEMLYHPASKVEHTGFFEVEGTACKVRPDLYNSENGMVLDLKTTLDASEKGFAKSVRQFGYAFQAAFYMTALRQMGERPKQFVFLVVEKTDEIGYYGTKDRTHVHDLQATMLHLLGLDHEKLTYDFQGRPFRLTDVSGNVIEKILA